jgi:hypothetical protein
MKLWEAPSETGDNDSRVTSGLFGEREEREIFSFAGEMW